MILTLFCRACLGTARPYLAAGRSTSSGAVNAVPAVETERNDERLITQRGMRKLRGPIERPMVDGDTLASSRPCLLGAVRRGMQHACRNASTVRMRTGTNRRLLAVRPRKQKAGAFWRAR